MLRIVVLPLLLQLAACAPRSPAVAVPSHITLAIVGVNVLPMDRNEVLHDQTVLIAGDRIVAITDAGVPIHKAVQLVDGRGHYLIPGLWDMHVHSLAAADAFFPLFLAFGVTGVRDMGGFLDTLLLVRTRTSSGALLGPRLVAAGPLLDGPRHRWSHPFARHLESTDQARALVDSLSRSGVDFLKIYSTLSREVYLALVTASIEFDLPFAGHIPFAVTAEEASDLGQVSLEHAGLDVTTLDCIQDGGARMRKLLGVWGADGYEAYLLGIEQLRRERNPTCVQALHARYRTNGTWVTPTVVNAIKDSASVNWRALSYHSDEARQTCVGTIQSFQQASDDVRDQYHRGVLEDIGMLHRAGVRLLAGTDAPNPCVVPGASLSDELEWLVRAGLTPFDALRTGTVYPAQYLGVADSLGVIRPGSIADMVLLDGNPLEDIRATRSITGVVMAGQYFDSVELASLVAARTK